MIQDTAGHMCQSSGQLLRVHFILDVQIRLHSITNSGLISGGQNSSRERQTVFFTAVKPMNKDHTDLQELDLTKPRVASYKMAEVEKAPGYGVIWVDTQLAQRKGFKSELKQGHSGRNHPLTIHSQLVVSRK